MRKSPDVANSLKRLLTSSFEVHLISMSGAADVELGIDAGNTQCVVSVVDSFGLRVVKATPSVVYIDSDRFYVGDQALRMGPRNPKNFIYDIQLMLGRSTKHDVIAKRRADWAFTTIDSHDGICVVVKDKNGRENRYPAWELWSQVLSAAVKSAEEELGLICKGIVMSYPLDRDEDIKVKTARETEVRKATENAGLRVIKDMDECTAAAQAYLFLTMLVDRMVPANNVMIFDLSATKLQMSWLTLKGSQYHVQRHQTIRDLGGRNFDDVLVNLSRSSFTDLSGYSGLTLLRLACEKAKVLFSTQSYVDITVDGFPQRVQRQHFEKETENLAYKCCSLFRKFVLSTRQQNFVILSIGGASNIRNIRAKLEKLFSGGQLLYKGLKCQEAVALGLLSDLHESAPSQPLPPQSSEKVSEDGRQVLAQPWCELLIIDDSGMEKQIQAFSYDELRVMMSDHENLTVTFTKLQDSNVTIDVQLKADIRSVCQTPPNPEEWKAKTNQYGISDEQGVPTSSPCSASQPPARQMRGGNRPYSSAGL